MRKCPSLTKALESDAGPCRSYCNHCPGWVIRVVTMAKHYIVYNIMCRDVPQCRYFITTRRGLAEAKKREWVAKFGEDVVYDNLDRLPHE